MITIKKVASIILTVAFVLCCASVAFATGSDVYTCPVCSMKYVTIEEYNNCLSGHNAPAESAHPDMHKCATCGKMFAELDSYNACVDSHFNNVNYHYDKYVGLTVPELCAALVEIFNESDAMETAQAIVDKSYDAIVEAKDMATVENELDDLESDLTDIDADVDLSEVEEIIDEIGNAAGLDESTEIVYPAPTGSSGVGVAMFATLSVATAAAFVLMKKKI